MEENNALEAARHIVQHLYGMGALSLPFSYTNEETGDTSYWEYDGLVLFVESIIAHQYNEEPRDESIPFSE